MLQRFTVLLLAGLAVGVNGFGSPLSPEEVIGSLEQHYPLILGARKDIEKSKADYQTARGGFDPVLKSTIKDSSLGYYANTYYDIVAEQPTAVWGTKVIAGYRRGMGNFAVYDSANQTFDLGEVRAGFEIPLLKGGWTDERRNRVSTGEIGVKAAEQSFSSKLLELKREAARKYWDWVAAGLKVKVAGELLEIALVRDRALAVRVKKGDAAQVDQIDNQRAVFQRQANLVSAKRSFQKAGLELSLYYRDSDGRPVLVEEERLPKEFPKAEMKTEPNSVMGRLDDLALQYPDTQILNLQLQQVGLEQSLARNQILPKLDLTFLAVKDLGTNRGNTYFPPSDYPSEFRVYLSFELPLYLRAARGKLDSITAFNQKLSFLESLTRDRIKNQIVDSMQMLTAALSRIDLTHKEVELSRRLEEAEKKRFLHGDSSLIFINLREQTTRDAMNKEIEALSDFFKAQAEYETYLF